MGLECSVMRRWIGTTSTHMHGVGVVPRVNLSVALFV